ncbi:MAG: hypothetical protein IKN33_02535, partial [Selenomonadaceae bacterium]|nr:hypothetical protein [Selenomonadaceae bacterium]
KSERLRYNYTRERKSLPLEGRLKHAGGMFLAEAVDEVASQAISSTSSVSLRLTPSPRGEGFEPETVLL